jgi:protein-S-isoprenylcysteine O-methyltransferase Ste14
MPLWLRAVLMSFLFPGVVAGVLPWRIAGGRWSFPLDLGPAWWLGWPLLLSGAAILLWTIWDFLHIGRGTLAPWDAPTVLVHQRLYRWTRNPMYVGVLGCILGQAVLWRSGGVFAYFAFIAFAFHVRVVGFEEPALLRQFGAGYAAYLQSVPRWIPRRPG